MALKRICLPLVMFYVALVGGCGGPGGAAPKPPYVLEKVSGPTIWTQLKRAIAVDSLDQIYVTSGTTIFRITANGPAIYLNAAAIASAVGPIADPSMLDIKSIDVGPDNKLYILEAFTRKILVSDAQGNVAVHRDISTIFGFPQLIGVVDSDNILLINLYDGMWLIKNSGSSLLYDNSLVLGGTNCGAEGLAVRHDGNFAYLPGCNGSPMVGGKQDGSGVGILLSSSIDFGIGNMWNFGGVGRNPAGGYVVNIGGSRIARITTTGQYELLHTEPELDFFATTVEGDSLAFYASPLAVGATGNIYTLSRTAVYVAKAR